MQAYVHTQENSMKATRIPAITQQQVAAFLKPRPQDSHKGQFGTVAIIGGNSGMIGAAILAGRDALKTGAGCVHIGLLAQHAPGVDMRQPELMVHDAKTLLASAPLPNPDRTTSHSTKPASGQVAGYLPQRGEGANVNGIKFDVMAIGCGMGLDLA